MIIQYEKTFQGAHKFYALNKHGQLITRQYFLTSKREALADFKHEFKNSEAQS